MTDMSHDEANSINIRLAGIEKNLDALTLAIQGDSKLGIEGVLQHLGHLGNEIKSLKTDVSELKNDKRTLKGWVAGLAAAGGFGGWIGHWFSK